MEILSYYRRENEVDTVVRFVAKLIDEIPQHKYQTMLWVWVDLEQPVTMECKPKFSNDYMNLENMLNRDLVLKLNLLYCGSILQEDGVVFYYYGNSARGFEQASRALLSNYSFNIGSSKDKQWNQYKYGIYPDSLNLQLMEDAEIINSLESSGDNLECEREVEYYFYGTSKEDLEKMCIWLNDQGFTQKDQFFNEHEKKYHFGMLCIRNQTINFMEMYDTTRGLFEYCNDHGLKYIGWGTKLCD